MKNFQSDQPLVLIFLQYLDWKCHKTGRIRRMSTASILTLQKKKDRRKHTTYPGILHCMCTCSSRSSWDTAHARDTCCFRRVRTRLCLRAKKGTYGHFIFISWQTSNYLAKLLNCFAFGPTRTVSLGALFSRIFLKHEVLLYYLAELL